jgi:hypothetical protein
MVPTVGRMKHITFGDKSLLVGDAVADALLQYAAFLAGGAKGDTVEIHAISSDGDEVVATFLLGPGVTMMAETANTKLPEPDNTAALEYMEKAQRRHEVTSTTDLSDLDTWDYDDTYGGGSQQPHPQN